MAEKLNIDAKLANGDYKPKMVFPINPIRPREPGIFSRKVGELIAKEAAIVPEEFSKHEKALEDYRAAVRLFEEAIVSYRNEEARIQAAFKIDCETFFFEGPSQSTDLTKERKRRVWEKAWQHGHANGLDSIWFWYKEFASICC